MAGAERLPSKIRAEAINYYRRFNDKIARSETKRASQVENPSTIKNTQVSQEHSQGQVLKPQQ